MDLTTQTPVEIDTALAKAYAEISQRTAKRDQAEGAVIKIDNVEPGSYESKSPFYSAESRANWEAKAERMQAEILDILVDEVAPRAAEFQRRGGWTRYYLVDNTNGHVHKDRECDTCYYTTEYAWLVEQSGLTAEALVDLAGEKACTVCFKWAPVDTLKQKTRLEAPERKAARLEREAQQAEREAKKTAKAITQPDGTPLRSKHGGVIATEVTAVTEAVDGLHERYRRLRIVQLLEADPGLAPFVWDDDNLQKFEAEGRADALRLVEAIAAKRWQSVEEVLAELEPKAYAKAKRLASGKAWVAEFKRQSTFRLEERDAYLAKHKADGTEAWAALSLPWPKF